MELAGHIKVLGGPDVAQACSSLSLFGLTKWSVLMLNAIS